jgi:hypothetical protein
MCSPISRKFIWLGQTLLYCTLGSSWVVIASRTELKLATKIEALNRAKWAAEDYLTLESTLSQPHRSHRLHCTHLLLAIYPLLTSTTA